MIILYEIISTSFLPGIKWHLQELYFFLPITLQLIIEIGTVLLDTVSLALYSIIPTYST